MSRRCKIAGSPLFPILDRVSDAIVIAAPDTWRVVYANRTAQTSFGVSSDSVSAAAETDLPLAAILAGRVPAEFMEQIEQFWQSGEAEATVSVDLSTDSRPVRAGVQFVRTVADDQPLLGVVIQIDSVAAADAPPGAAHRLDPLTSLPDRTFLFTRLAALMNSERTADRRFAVLFVDLDNFKPVNDELGHLVGDRVLHEVARRLVDSLREGDHVVRYGGDEFVVLIEGVAAPADVDPIIRRIHAVLASPIALPEGEVTLSVSIGSAEASPEYNLPEDVLAAADRAMYAAKRSND